ncbi:MAG: hypothetical protein VKJ24_00175 [Synechococcales bacterium]|nr:hypothetical protein [Synechococcales bacterium]
MVHSKKDPKTDLSQNQVKAEIAADLLNVLIPTDAAPLRHSLLEKLNALAKDSKESLETDRSTVDPADTPANPTESEIAGLASYDSPKAKIAYPWNPAESINFLVSDELDDIFNGLDPQEIDDRAQDFFATLNQLWEQSLQSRLSRKFANVPQQILKAIAEQADQIVTTSTDLADQLVTCVQAALPLWNTEDLYVFARPVAYAMRGENNLNPSADLQRDWESLSEVEQAKLTLAIAHYALNQAAATQE